MSLTLEPIGWVRSTRTSATDDDWDQETTTIELADRFGPDALFGLDEFSHVDVVYVFDRVAADGVESGARRPRANPEWPLVGIFAQRGKNRPNRLGVTTCELLEVNGTVVAVKGLDAIDGTPVVDLKPHMSEFGPRTEVRQPAWSIELMRGYWG
jgi:tRNA (adenine37-N6)-methyltransferase